MNYGQAVGIGASCLFVLLTDAIVARSTSVWFYVQMIKTPGWSNSWVVQTYRFPTNLPRSSRGIYVYYLAVVEKGRLRYLHHTNRLSSTSSTTWKNAMKQRVVVHDGLEFHPDNMLV